MTAFEIITDTFIDQCELELAENKELPPVLDARNPYDFRVWFEGGIWKCEARFQDATNPDNYVMIRRWYTPEHAVMLSQFYPEEENFAGVTLKRDKRKGART